MFTRILVPTDFSEPSDAALEYAKSIAAEFNASLHLLHVFEDPAPTAFGTEFSISESAEAAAAFRQAAEKNLAARLTPDEKRCFKATQTMAGGPIASTIIETAVNRGIDLIVMGTHGRKGLAHAVMGSVAERVVQKAHCPVLTVHAAPQPVAIAVTSWKDAPILLSPNVLL